MANAMATRLNCKFILQDFNKNVGRTDLLGSPFLSYVIVNILLVNRPIQGMRITIVFKAVNSDNSILRINIEYIPKSSNSACRNIECLYKYTASVYLNLCSGRRQSGRATTISVGEMIIIPL